MQLKLRVLDGNKVGSEVVVSGPKFLIGRDADCQLRPSSDLISRHHCVLIIEQGYVGVRDFDSKNGTFVNDERVVGECELKAGDKLAVGPLHFSVHLDHSVGGPKKPKVKDVKEAMARTAERASDEFDVSDWLEDDETPQDDTETSAPAPSATSDTTTIDLAQPDEATVPATKTPSRLPSELLADMGKKPKSKDTRSAAADVLRKLAQQKLEKKKSD